MFPKITKEIFIQRAREIHGEKYDYSKVEYVNANSKVCIVCSKHGDFWQRAWNHLDGRGCNICAHEYVQGALTTRTQDKCYKIAKQFTTFKDFRLQQYSIYSAALKNGWLKDYTWLKYSINMSKPKKKRHFYTQEEFVFEIQKQYGQKYDCSLVKFVNMKTPISLICKEKGITGIEHGLFHIRPDNLLNLHQGCPQCGIIKRNISQSLTLPNFINRANQIHNDKYDYSKTNYKNVKTKIIIICPLHGEFTQTPFNHLMGKGCPYCSHNAKIWNKENCEQEAKKYQYAHDFRLHAPGALNVAKRNGWYATYTWLKRLPAKEKDFTRNTCSIYAYEFSEFHAVYVGLTNSVIRRDKEHRNKNSKSSVNKFAIMQSCTIPIPKIMESNIPREDSGKREHHWVNFYLDNGWNIINEAKTGERESSLGAVSNLKWNRKAIKKVAEECNFDLTIFCHKYSGAYNAIKNRYPEMLEELFPNRMKHTYHTIEEALEIVKELNITTKKQLREQCPWANLILYKNHLFGKVFGEPKVYTSEEAVKEAQQYSSINQIREKKYSLWKYLHDNNLFKIAKPTDIMFHRCRTIEDAWELSQYYRNMTELSNHAKTAYRILRNNNLLQKRYPDSKKYTYGKK